MEIFQTVFLGDTIGFYISKNVARRAILTAIYDRFAEQDFGEYLRIEKEFDENECVEDLDIWIISDWLDMTEEIYYG